MKSEMNKQIIIITIMKKLTVLGLAIMLFIQGQGYARENSQMRVKQDSLSFITLSGKVIDQSTKSPVVFASVYKTGSSIGTVTNADGEFILKIAGKSTEGTVTIAFLGFKSKVVDITTLLKEGNIVSLEPFAVAIDEVVIKTIDPLELIKDAIAKIRDNYTRNPEMQTGFYRETIKQNKNYVAISEAVLDIYNSGYKDGLDFDRVKIYKGRKSKDVRKMDTVLVKFQGGPRTAMFLDIVKNPGFVLDPEFFDKYFYKLAGVVSIDGKDNYVVEFDQKLISEYPLYQGKIYIDRDTKAITGIDFKISELGLPAAASDLVKKKPVSMKMDVLSGNYLVNYRVIDGKWVLNYVRSEVVFRSKWEKKLFKSNITTMFEMAITDTDPQNVEKFASKESVKYSDVLADQVTAFQDDNFWGEYNTIKPDESIQVAIEKLNKKLKRINR
jgi:hypothetical protein